MLKQSIIFLVLSTLVIVFAKYVHIVIVYIDMLYTWLNVTLAPIFNEIGLSPIVRQILLLILIPILIALIPAGIYRLTKGKTIPHFFAWVWCLWLVIVLSNVLIH